MNAKATLADVARAAGVSIGTASNAFNRPERVREAVLQQIRQAADALGYRGPDPAGRLLMGGKANVIGVLPPGDMSVSHAFRSPYFRDFMLGIAEVCDDEGANLIVLSGDADRKGRAIRTALVDGFILGQRDELDLVAARRLTCASVLVDLPAPPDQNAVGIDGRSGGRLAADHLLSLGHRRFGIVTVARRPTPPVIHAETGSPPTLRHAFPLDLEKLAGFAEGLAAHGLSIGDVPIVEGYIPQAGAAAAILDAAPYATAIFAMSDIQALAIMTAARERGLTLPDDLSVIGFDGLAEGEIVQPPLTTILQSTIEKGRVSARMLFSSGPAEQVVLPVRLVVRGSTGPVPTK